MDTLFAGEYSVGTEFCVRGGYLSGRDYAKEVDEEEIPLGRVGYL